MTTDETTADELEEATGLEWGVITTRHFITEVSWFEIAVYEGHGEDWVWCGLVGANVVIESSASTPTALSAARRAIEAARHELAELREQLPQQVEVDRE